MTLSFRPQYIFDSHAARAGRMAVLYPLHRPASSHKQIKAMTKATVKWWRQRLHQLGENDWFVRPNSRSSAFAANCWPSFCFCKPRTAPCTLAAICPFCFSRDVSHIYTRIAGTVATLPDQPNWKLIERTKAIREPWLDTPELLERAAAATRPSKGTAIPALGLSPQELAAIERKLAISLRIAVRSRRQWITARAPLGAYTMFTVEPGTDCWHVSSRQLLVVPRDYELPPEAPCSPLAEPARIRQTVDLSSRNVARAVARAFAYPTLLMAGPADLVAVSLRARRHVRLSAAFGALRNVNATAGP